MSFAIVAFAIAVAPLADAGRGKQSPTRATARVQPTRDGQPIRLTRSSGRWVGAMRAASAEAERPEPTPPRRRVATEFVEQVVEGIAFDGPRHTYRAIRKNPIKFVLGMAGMGAVGVAGVLFYFPGEWVAVGLSSVAVAAQIKLAWPHLKELRGSALARRIGSDVIWPTALFLGTWWLGHSIVGDHVAHSAPSLAALFTAFISSAIIGGDAPAVGVTALDTARGGDGVK